jgi:drug/metabolite transporter (DMT)-like permease
VAGDRGALRRGRRRVGRRIGPRVGGGVRPAGALDSLANLAFLLAVRDGDLAVVAVITALYPAGTVLLARAVLGERIGRTQLTGLGLAAMAVSLLAVG